MSGGLGQLGLSVAVFLASHSFTNLRPVRRAGERVFGRLGFVAAYSIFSLALLGWMVAAARGAPFEPLWPKAPWTLWIPPLLMPFACILAVAGMTTPNPFSIGPGGGGYDPARPGILRITRHPVLWSLSLWAGAHTIANGDVAGLMLFGPLLALALAGPVLLDAKRRRSLGDKEYRRLAAMTGRPADFPRGLSEMGWARAVSGLVLYSALLALHPLVIGLGPLPY